MLGVVKDAEHEHAKTKAQTAAMPVREAKAGPPPSGPEQAPSLLSLFSVRAHAKHTATLSRTSIVHRASDE